MGRAYAAFEAKRKKEAERDKVAMDFAQNSARESMRQYAKAKGMEWDGEENKARKAMSSLPEFKNYTGRFGDGEWTDHGWSGDPSTQMISEARKDNPGGGNFSSVSDWEGVNDYYENKLHEFRDQYMMDRLGKNASKAVKVQPLKEEPKDKAPSQAVNQARAYVGQTTQDDKSGATTASKFGTQLPGITLGQESSFTQNYKNGIKSMLVPTAIRPGNSVGGVSTSSKIAAAAKEGALPGPQKATDPSSTWGADTGYINSKQRLA